MSKKQTVFNLLFLVIVFGLTMYLVFRGKDIGDIIRTAREADGRYLLPVSYTHLLSEEPVIKSWKR